MNEIKSEIKKYLYELVKLRTENMALFKNRKEVKTMSEIYKINLPIIQEIQDIMREKYGIKLFKFDIMYLSTKRFLDEIKRGAEQDGQ